MHLLALVAFFRLALKIWLHKYYRLGLCVYSLFCHMAGPWQPNSPTRAKFVEEQLQTWVVDEVVEQSNLNEMLGRGDRESKHVPYRLMEP